MLNKALLILIALSLPHAAYTMKRDHIVSSKQTPKRAKTKSISIIDEELAAQAQVQKYLAGDPFALHSACRKKNRAIIMMFVKAKASITEQDSEGWTPLHHLCYCSILHVSRKWQRGISLDRSVEMLNLMLNYDPSGINIQDHEGTTPLHLAAQGGEVALVRILLKFGADPNRVNNAGKSALHCAIQYKGDAKKRTDIIQELLDYQSFVDAQDHRGATPLHYAAFYGYWCDCMVLLIKAGARYISDNKGEGPLHYIFKEELEDTFFHEEFWVQIVDTYNATKAFDQTFAALLWAFPHCATSFTQHDSDEAQSLLLGYISNADIEIVEPNFEQEESPHHIPFNESILSFVRAIEMIYDPVKQKIAVEAAGNSLREALLHSVCKKGSVITLLHNRAATGKLKT